MQVKKLEDAVQTIGFIFSLAAIYENVDTGISAAYFHSILWLSNTYNIRDSPITCVVLVLLVQSAGWVIFSTCTGDVYQPEIVDYV